MTNTNDRTRAGGRTTLQRAAQAMGIVFLLVGILGFIPGITSNYGTMQFAGHESGALLLGIFQVSILHNIVHLLFGVAGLAMAKTVSGSKNYLLGGGIIYAILWIYGLVIGQDSAANFVPVNTADNWLHFILAVAMIGLALALSRGARDRSART
jgi:arginine exporter protein ArgO